MRLWFLLAAMMVDDSGRPMRLIRLAEISEAMSRPTRLERATLERERKAGLRGAVPDGEHHG